VTGAIFELSNARTQLTKDQIFYALGKEAGLFSTKRQERWNEILAEGELNND
jgi:hypothetical protein